MDSSARRNSNFIARNDRGNQYFISEYPVVEYVLRKIYRSIE